MRLLGDVVAREDGEGGRQAEGLYMEALAWVCKLEMRPLAALCHMSLGILLAEHSRREQGSAHLAQAVEMLQQMDMKFWLKSATDYRSVRANR